MAIANMVSALGAGFSGLAFVLALLVYKRLLFAHKIGSTTENQLKLTYAFMLFASFLALMAALTPLISKMMEEKPNILLESAARSMENRKPLPLDFVTGQIDKLTDSHNQRLTSLHKRREIQESKIEGISDSDDLRELERALRRTEQQIRQESRDYESKVSRFRNML